MTEADKRAYKYQQIAEIVKNCEDFCEDRYESDYAKRSMVRTSYKQIAEIVMEVGECQLSSYMT
jgi:hypothetical protein